MFGRLDAYVLISQIVAFGIRIVMLKTFLKVICFHCCEEGVPSQVHGSWVKMRLSNLTLEEFHTF